MATTTITANKQCRTADNGSNMGAGVGDYTPFGTYSGYNYRTFIGWSSPSWSGWTKITKATLYCRNSTQYYVAFGSSPSAYIDLITESWSEGSSSSLSTGNATVHPGPSTSSANRVSKNTGATEGAWWSADITGIINQAHPGTFYGVRIIAQSTSAADVGEIYADDSSSEPYIVIEYETNRVPNTPVVTEPPLGLTLDTAPDFQFSASDPDAGNTLKNYDIQVALDSAFTSLVWNIATQTAGIAGWAVGPIAYAGTALVPGTTYYYRVRVRDQSDATSAYSATRTFQLNKPPEIVGADLPYGGANHVAPITNLADLVTTLAPKPRFVFTPRSPVGSPVTGYQVEVQTLAGAAVATETDATTRASGTAVTHNFGTALTNLSSYRVRFRAQDALEGYGPWSAFTTFAVKYAQAIYDLNMPSASAITTALVLGAGKAQLLYRTATGAGGAGASAWSPNVPATVPARLNVMLRTASEGSAPAQPKVTTFTISYQQSLVLPYSWSFIGQWSLDANVRRYGLKSLLLSPGASPAGADHIAYQNVPNLAAATDYVLSFWVLVEGYTAGGIKLLVLPTGSIDPAAALASLTIARNTAGWERLTLPYRTSEGVDTVRIALLVDKNMVIPTQVHVDGAMLSEGTVAATWTPALTGAPIIIDAQGLLIDGQAGSIIRITPNNPVAPVIELNNDGLKNAAPYVGTVAPTDPWAGQLWWDTDDIGTSITGSGTSFPVGPTTDMLFYRTDLDILFFFDGTRWLSTTIFSHAFPTDANNLAATTGDIARIPPPPLRGCSDIYFIDVDATVYVSGGTALSASHKWLAEVRGGAVAGSGTTTGITTKTIDSGAVSTWRRDAAQSVAEANRLLAGRTYLYLSATKTGTPGNLYFYPTISYRLVG